MRHENISIEQNHGLFVFEIDLDTQAFMGSILMEYVIGYQNPRPKILKY
jgi:hypothetical protein